MDVSELYIDSVQHDFDGKPVLSGVYLTCCPGERIGLLGRNGSGKSTLLKIIFGALRAKYQHIKIDGHLISAGYATGKIAYLPQHRFIPRSFRVKELISLYVHKHRQMLLNIAFMKEHYDSPLSELSGGQQRLAEALLILYSDADYVLLDEPFSQLAPLAIEYLQEHIVALNSKGFIVTDHMYEQNLKIATKTILLHNGSTYPIKSREELVLHNYLPG